MSEGFLIFITDEWCKSFDIHYAHLKPFYDKYFNKAKLTRKNGLQF